MLAQVAAVDLCSSYRILGAQQRIHSHALGRPRSKIWEGCSALCRCNPGGQAPLCRDRSAAAGLGCNMCPQSGGAVGERESIAKPHRYCPITGENFLLNHIFSHFSRAIQLCCVHSLWLAEMSYAIYDCKLSGTEDPDL